MKTGAALFILLASLCLAEAQSPSVLLFGRASSGSSTMLVHQDFEGTGYDNGETWTEEGSATLDEDYTGTVLDGSQSFRVVELVNNGLTYTSYTPLQTNLWAYFLFRPVTIDDTSLQPIVSLATNTSVQQSINVTPVTHFLRLAMQTSVSTVSTVSAGTTYHVWLHYIRFGSGGDAEGSVAFSTTGIKPTSGNNFASLTGQTATKGLLDRIILMRNSGGTTQEYLIDKIRVSTVEIGDNPP